MTPHSPLTFWEILLNFAHCYVLKIMKMSKVSYTSTQISHIILIKKTVETYQPTERLKIRDVSNTISRIFKISDFPWNSIDNIMLLYPWHSFMRLCKPLSNHNNSVKNKKREVVCFGIIGLNSKYWNPKVTYQHAEPCHSWLLSLTLFLWILCQPQFLQYCSNEEELHDHIYEQLQQQLYTPICPLN